MLHAIVSPRGREGSVPLNRQQLLDRRNDLSQFLFHLTRTGDLKRAKDLYSLQRDDVVPVDAHSSLEAILRNRRIEARSAFGYFNFKIRYTRSDGRVLNPGSQIKRDWLKAVCFTETPIDHVHLQTEDIQGRQLKFQPFGLAFRESVVRRANGNPIFYVQTTCWISRELSRLISPKLSHPISPN
jgi:hypothetical protein